MAAAKPPLSEEAETRTLLSYANRPIAFFGRYVGRHKLAYGVIWGTVLGAVACSVGSNYAVKNLIDVISSSDPAAPGTGPWIAFAILAGVIAADNFLWRIAGWIAAKAFPRTTAQMREDLFQHLGGHAPGWFAARSAGTLSSRISATGTACFTLLQNITWHTMPPAVAVSFAIFLLSTVDPLMAGSLGLAALLLGLVIARLSSAGQSLHMSFAEQAAAVDGGLTDVVQNINLVRAFGAFGREKARFTGSLLHESTTRTRSLRYLEKLRLTHAVATATLTAGLLVWAILLWEQGKVTTGDIVLVCTLGFTILHASRDLAVALVDLTQYLARVSEALRSLLVPHDLPDAPDAGTLVAKGGAVTFRDITFGYPGNEPVLRGFNLDILPGQSVGLVGRSGAGKSTLLTLLQRHAAPLSGTVLIDGQDIAQMTRQSLSEALAIVPQDVSMFHRSLKENIRYAKPDATEAEVAAAAEAAQCRDFIAAMPEGFDTIVGERGAKLSGGQRQRLAIARALLKDAPILLLDEATSALDSESEAAIQVALETLMEGRTVIAVAHRLATLRDFDRVIVLEAGRVVQDGPPNVLARQPGLYRDLIELQAASVQVET